MKVSRNLLKAFCIANILCFSFFVQNTYSQTKKNGEVYNPDGIELVYVEGNGNIKGFYIGKYEITQKEWNSVMDTNRSKFNGDNLPVENVSWDDAQEFINRLNEKTGKNYRLPTEAEWEYVAKGGSNNNTYEYAGSNNIDEVTWYEKNSDDKTHAVGTKNPNTLGIYDMSGNVWEWCQDKCRWDSEKKEVVLDEKGSNYVGCGGGWNGAASGCRVAHRHSYDPSHRRSNLGFRVVIP